VKTTVYIIKKHLLQPEYGHSVLKGRMYVFLLQHHHAEAPNFLGRFPSFPEDITTSVQSFCENSLVRAGQESNTSKARFYPLIILHCISTPTVTNLLSNMSIEIIQNFRYPTQHSPLKITISQSWVQDMIWKSLENCSFAAAFLWNAHAEHNGENLLHHQAQC
jgi:hypothetical protein